MLAELLLINGKGLNARALGDPAVHGPVLKVLYSASARTLYVAFVVSSVGEG